MCLFDSVFRDFDSENVAATYVRVSLRALSCRNL